MKNVRTPLLLLIIVGSLCATTEEEKKSARVRNLVLFGINNCEKMKRGETGALFSLMGEEMLIIEDMTLLRAPVSDYAALAEAKDCENCKDYVNYLKMILANCQALADVGLGYLKTNDPRVTVLLQYGKTQNQTSEIEGTL